jgi:hypothetical protein
MPLIYSKLGKGSFFYLHFYICLLFTHRSIILCYNVKATESVSQINVPEKFIVMTANFKISAKNCSVFVNNIQVDS